MANNLDMSLDDLIKKNKTSSSRGRGGGGATARRFPDRLSRRPAPYPTANAKYGVYTEQQIAAAAAAAAAASTAGTPRVSSIETGTKLYISNLDYGVTNEDIKELFTEVGDIKRYSINYDRSGRSKGTAEVVYARREDALAAISRYNNVQLDGKPMKIELVGTNVETPAAPVSVPVPLSLNWGLNGAPGILNSAPGIINSAPGILSGPPGILNGAPGILHGPPGILNGGPKSGPGRGGISGGWTRGSSIGDGGRGQGRGRGRGRGRGKPPSAADLDAELDKYHADAMESN